MCIRDRVFGEAELDLQIGQAFVGVVSRFRPLSCSEWHSLMGRSGWLLAAAAALDTRHVAARLHLDEAAGKQHLAHGCGLIATVFEQQAATGFEVRGGTGDCLLYTSRCV